MAKINKTRKKSHTLTGRISTKTTHGGGTGEVIDPHSALKRTLTNCLLFEPNYYEKGNVTAQRLVTLALDPNIEMEFLRDQVAYARQKLGLRSAPLYLAAATAHRHGEKRRVSTRDADIVFNTIFSAIQRADELSEFVAMYWQINGHKAPLGAQVKKALAASFDKFDEYRLAKYNRKDAKVRLRDVMFLTHPRPKNAAQRRLFEALADDKLAPPDTWEVALSSGADKKATWTRLLDEGALGGLAFLRNLRNMGQVGVDRALIRGYFKNIRWSTSRIFPHQFLMAARVMPEWEIELEAAMQDAQNATLNSLPGHTLLVIDVSGSMTAAAGGKYLNGLRRVDCASTLAMSILDAAEEATVYATAGSDSTQVHRTERIAPRRGFGLVGIVDAAGSRMGGGGIFLTQAMDFIAKEEGIKSTSRRPSARPDRVIVLTDEQDCDLDKARSMNLAKKLGVSNYIVNLGVYDRGISDDAGWRKVHGFAERIVPWIVAAEELEATLVA